MVTDAWAQTAGGAAGGPPMNPLLMQVPYFVVMIVLFYLILIRPQQQQKKTLEKMLGALKKGDRVVTSGGIIGTVIDVDDTRAVLRTGGEVKLEFLKSAIVQVLAEKS